jgi:GGDEF domain-containing protein
MGNNCSRIPALWEQGVHRSTSHKAKSAFGPTLASRGAILQEESFHSMLTLERRRAERSRKTFALMLLDASTFIQDKTADRFMSRVTSVVLKSTRETDLVGWYEKGVILGVIFTEISPQCENPIAEILHSKIVNALQEELNREIASNLVITVHLFPESQGRNGAEPGADSRFYPDLSKGRSKKHLPLVVKRAIDVAGSEIGRAHV